MSESDSCSPRSWNTPWRLGLLLSLTSSPPRYSHGLRGALEFFPLVLRACSPSPTNLLTDRSQRSAGPLSLPPRMESWISSSIPMGSFPWYAPDDPLCVLAPSGLPPAHWLVTSMISENGTNRMACSHNAVYMDHCVRDTGIAGHAACGPTSQEIPHSSRVRHSRQEHAGVFVSDVESC